MRGNHARAGYLHDEPAGANSNRRSPRPPPARPVWSSHLGYCLATLPAPKPFNLIQIYLNTYDDLLNCAQRFANSKAEGPPRGMTALRASSLFNWQRGPLGGLGEILGPRKRTRDDSLWLGCISQAITSIQSRFLRVNFGAWPFAAHERKTLR